MKIIILKQNSPEIEFFFRNLHSEKNRYNIIMKKIKKQLLNIIESIKKAIFIDGVI
mgnify:CR=1 FL=1